MLISKDRANRTASLATDVLPLKPHGLYPRFRAAKGRRFALFGNRARPRALRHTPRMTDDETHRTGELLLSLAGKHSIVVVEHDMTFVKQIARDGKVTVLHQGTVLCEGKFDEVQADTKVREVYLGRGKHGTR